MGVKHLSCSVHSAVLQGVKAIPVEVEVVISSGLPSFSIVGMADSAVQESRERVKAALRSRGFTMPNDKIVVNLSPGSVRKNGTGFDLPIALALLVATHQLPKALVQDSLVIGELSLDGAVHPVNGVLAYRKCAEDLHLSMVVSRDAQAAVPMGDVVCYGVESLSDFRAKELREMKPHPRSFTSQGPDFSQVRGQEMAKRALQVAAVGNHGVLMVGPPGSGKTFLARCFASILPPLDEQQRLESALVHSVTGLDVDPILAGRRPFRNPHHSVTAAGMVGGGSPVRPGEVSLAHNGVLFLDELAEFKPQVLQQLRQPLEEGTLRLTRAEGTYEFPAKFSLLAATNPCPCGYYGDPNVACTCSENQVRTYQNRIGGPLLDRIDIRMDIWRSDVGSLLEGPPGADSATLAEGVERGIAFARRRLHLPPSPAPPPRASLQLAELKEQCAMQAEGRKFFDSLVGDQTINARSVVRMLALARTIADIDECAHVGSTHLSQAYQFRFKGSTI